jgi:DTW domain-containing protein YfiP
LLLYPALPQDLAWGTDQGDPAPAQPPAPPENFASLRLIVLDGTWRKSRKMLYLNPPLQRLPRLMLSDPPPSSYLIRKAHRPNQLSTLEASCAALAQLEADGQTYQPLLAAFDGFVQSLIRHTVRSPANQN